MFIKITGLFEREYRAERQWSGAEEWMEYHIFLIYQKLTVQDFNFQLFVILRVSTLRFGGSPLLFITFYSNPSGRGVNDITDFNLLGY